MKSSVIREFTVRGTSMEPLYQEGDKISFSLDNHYQLGDIVLFHNRGKLIGHRIVSITEKGIVAKGDNNHFIDGGYYDQTDIIGTIHEMDATKQHILDNAKKRRSFYNNISFSVTEDSINNQLSDLINYYGIKVDKIGPIPKGHDTRILIDSTSSNSIFANREEIKEIAKKHRLHFYFGFPLSDQNKDKHYDYCFRVGEYGFSDILNHQWEIPYVLSMLESICEG